MNIFFSGIGGVGIGPLAQIAADAGYEVQGSDAKESLMTRQLKERGIPVSIGTDATFLQACHDTKPIDWLVHTAGLPASHPELLLAKKLGIKIAKRDELLARIIEEKNLKLIACAGTHGKTTSSSMMVWLLQQLGTPVSYSVGSTLSFGPSGKFSPDSEYFVYECDEFDRNFLHFSPYLSLITSIGYDHPDIYPTEAAYRAAFNEFIGQSAMTIMWHGDANELAATSVGSWVLNDNEAIQAKIPGAHNRRNATLAVKAVEYLQLAPREKAISILEKFPGSARRFERLANNLYTDYAVHPTEIAVTLQMARELSDHVVAVYQPHQNIRQHEMRGRYTDCFELAEAIYWLPTYLAREDPALPVLTPAQLTENITNKANVRIAEMDDELWQAIQQAREDGKLVLVMGAGSIDAWLRSRLDA